MPTNKQQREAARRKLQRQLERRAQAEARRRKLLVGITVAAVVIALGVVIAVTVGLSGGSPSTPAALPSPSPSGPTTGPCKYTPVTASNPNLKNVGLPPDPSPTPTINRTMTFTTNLGSVVVTLDGAAAPCNVQSLSYLAQKGFYNNTPCPRAVDSGIFVLQCGDPSGTGQGGPTYTVKDENLAAANYSAGTVAMANSGPNTNSSQFFFITQDSNGGLQKNYTVVGHVTQGLNILSAVVAAGNDGSNPAGGGKPKQPVTLLTVTVTPPLAIPASGSSGAAPTGTTKPSVSGSPTTVPTAPTS